MAQKPLNVGLVGGGKGAFIVQPHQKAIHFDGTRRVVAGALFPDPKIALEEAEKWPYPFKGYGSYDEMIAANKGLPEDQKLDYILIVTPNFVHFDPAMKAMKAGIPVFCEKPLCLNLKEANDLVKTARKLNIPFGVAHTYLGHWTSRLSRFIVRSGLLGDIRWGDSYYIQGWFATKLEATGQMQAAWRTNPKLAGGSGCGGDIGTHALMQLRYVTGLDVSEVSAQLETFVEGRPLDDHFTIYCKLSNGGKALVRASQICIGYKNDLGIVIAGTKGTLRWRQEDPECLTIHLANQPDRVYWRGAVTPGDGFLPKEMPDDLMAEPTIPSGHPEAFHDAFARLHRCFEADVRKWKAGEKFACDGAKYANIEDGWMGIAFIETCVKSSAKKCASVDDGWKKNNHQNRTSFPRLTFRHSRHNHPPRRLLQSDLSVKCSGSSGAVGKPFVGMQPSMSDEGTLVVPNWPMFFSDSQKNAGIAAMQRNMRSRSGMPCQDQRCCSISYWRIDGSPEELLQMQDVFRDMVAAPETKYNPNGVGVDAHMPFRLFYSYAHRDEIYREDLETHLKVLKREGRISEWHDRMILPGEDWKNKIDDNLASANIILLMVSPEFLASDYCWDVEVQHALKRHERGDARVIPVILRPADWQSTPLGRLQALPKNGKPIALWQDKDSAWQDVCLGIKKVIGEFGLA